MGFQLTLQRLPHRLHWSVRHQSWSIACTLSQNRWNTWQPRCASASLASSMYHCWCRFGKRLQLQYHCWQVGPSHTWGTSSSTVDWLNQMEKYQAFSFHFLNGSRNWSVGGLEDSHQHLAGGASMGLQQNEGAASVRCRKGGGSAGIRWLRTKRWLLAWPGSGAFVQIVRLKPQRLVSGRRRRPGFVRDIFKHALLRISWKAANHSWLVFERAYLIIGSHNSGRQAQAWLSQAQPNQKSPTGFCFSSIKDDRSRVEDLNMDKKYP